MAGTQVKNLKIRKVKGPVYLLMEPHLIAKKWHMKVSQGGDFDNIRVLRATNE